MYIHFVTEVLLAGVIYNKYMFNVRHMHNKKLVNAQQAITINSYKNTEKLLRAKAATRWFNKLCRTDKLTPQYITIKINENNRKKH